MLIFVLIISIYFFIKTVSYGIYEIKNNNNKPAGILVIVIGILGSFFPNIVLLLN